MVKVSKIQLILFVFVEDSTSISLSMLSAFVKCAVAQLLQLILPKFFVKVYFLLTIFQYKYTSIEIHLGLSIPVNKRCLHQGA